jgi:DNA-binding transcriptional LysR family regulator
MELRQLRYFVVLAEELHFGRAAARLFIVQPALSKQIASLEKELGTELFVRSRRQVEMTAAGRSLLADARQLLAQIDGVSMRARLASRGEVGVLEIGFIVPALYDLLPYMLRRYRTVYPAVELSLHELHTRDIVNRVLSRDLHIGFTRLPVSAGGDLLQVRPLVEELLLVAMPADHPAAAGESVALADLATEDFILITRSAERELHDWHVAACAAAGFTPRVAHQVDRTNVAVGLVASGLGLCFVPEALRLAPHPGVAYRPLDGPRRSITIGAIWYPDCTDPVLRTFLDVQPWNGTRNAVAGLRELPVSA